MGTKLACALVLIGLTLTCSACATQKPKALLTDFPDYFDLPAGSELTTSRNYGKGPEAVQIKTLKDMGCFSLTAQVDALSIKKGAK